MPDMGSFGAVPFGVRIDGADRTTESEFAGMHIPGSDIAIIDKGGKLPEQLSYELYFAASTAYDDMRAKVRSKAVRMSDVPTFARMSS